MSATAKQPEASVVIMKAFNNACTALDLGMNEKAKLLGVNRSTLNRKVDTGFPLDSKESEIQLNFVRIYRSLYAVAGGDSGFMKHWFKTRNKALNATPAELCNKITGIVRVNMYLDAMRGKV